MSRLTKAMIISLLFGIMGVIASILPIGLDLEENIGLRVLFGLRGVREPPPDVVILSLDKLSTDNLNLPVEPEILGLAPHRLDSRPAAKRRFRP